MVIIKEENSMVNIEKSYERKLHLESGNFSFVVDKKVYNGNIKECDEEIALFILENFEQVRFEIDLTKESPLYMYIIWNGGEYEMRSETVIYSSLYFTDTEFTEIVNSHKVKFDDLHTAINITKKDKRFIFLTCAGYESTE